MSFNIVQGVYYKQEKKKKKKFAREDRGYMTNLRKNNLLFENHIIFP